MHGISFLFDPKAPSKVYQSLALLSSKILTERRDCFDLPVNGRGRGDQYVRVNLEVPTNLSSKQKEALKDFDSLTGDKNYHKRKGFFDKLKDFMKD